MLKSEDPISQRRTSAKSFTEVTNENKESKSQEIITQYSDIENESVIQPIEETQFKGKFTTNPDSRSILDLLENETKTPIQLEADRSFEERENNGNKSVCCGCVREVFSCISWYFGNIADCILTCFRRCGRSCCTFKGYTSRNAGEPDENYPYFDDNKDAFCTFEDDNIKKFNHEDGEAASSATSVAGTYRLVSDKDDVIHKSGQNIEVTDKRSSSPKALSVLDGGDVHNVNRYYTVENVKPIATTHDRCGSDAPMDNINNNSDVKFHDKATSLTNYCSDVDVRDVPSHFTVVEHNETSSSTHDCPVFESYGGGSDNTGGGGFDSGGGDFSTD